VLISIGISSVPIEGFIGILTQMRRSCLHVGHDSFQLAHYLKPKFDRGIHIASFNKQELKDRLSADVVL
jgi:hypothetical protein